MESGEANISVVRLDALARSLEVPLASLLGDEPTHASPTPPRPEGTQRLPIVSLLGLRGAGKSTLGSAAARKLGLPFVELDARVEQTAGLSIAALLELHGHAYYREIEREALRAVLEPGTPCVVATSGGIVTDHETFELLRVRTTTVWLRARPEDHLARVVAQGDVRPMRDRTDAMDDLRKLLLARKALYERAAHAIDTSRLGETRSAERLTRIGKTATRTPERR